MHHVHGPSPPNKNILVIEVNDHGPRITSQYFLQVYVKMTPQGIYSIKIFVSLLDNFMTPQGSYSIQIFVSLLRDFRSILGQNEFKL